MSVTLSSQVTADSAASGYTLSEGNETDPEKTPKRLFQRFIDAFKPLPTSSETKPPPAKEEAKGSAAKQDSKGSENGAANEEPKDEEEAEDNEEA